MIKKLTSLLLLLTLGQLLHAQPVWKIAGNKILTPWSKNINTIQPWLDYPRPQMQRDAWTNLNGLWDYAVLPVKEAAPTAFAEKILVPFAIESAMSGVGKMVGKDSALWYHRRFELPDGVKNKRLLLQFGAVDWQCTIWINGQEAGHHQGGYTPFSVDITPFLKQGAQELLIKVLDPTDDGPQPRGKQVKKPEGIWYTSVTGIWQTVWLEAVSATHFTAVLPGSDIDRNVLSIETEILGAVAGDILKIHVSDRGKVITAKTAKPGEKTEFILDKPKRWSPAEPFLYDINVQLFRDGALLDEVNTYAALRKISIAPDKNGVQRLMLNNEFLFQLGLLDQGWWPDGLYTAVSDKALKFDIEQCKAMGFNLLRKHVKLEPARWYYHCDRLGMLVWQDMPSGDLGNRWITDASEEPIDKIRTAESEGIYKAELKDMIDALRFFPSIVTWVPFNEAWGQFKTDEITRWIMDYDKTRLVNCASGGNFFLSGHIHDYHHYPDPVMHRAELFGKNQAIVLGEFGGLGLPLEGHTWQGKANWGYQSFENAGALFEQYSKFVGTLREYIPKGLSGAIYTQVSDVEIEVNGLMTYDRKVIKMPVEQVKKVNETLFQIKE